ncbi:MAG TPA: tripartite tricarboxylate transporter substrate binding protein [Burkholderiales bacterium]|jgi:tripartite-type tricarboxylate transporter receptor subunit TctC|nr:tripartite tricarboxylate transporter substrate binding protein [Burkholderiales bacterium]
MKVKIFSIRRKEIGVPVLWVFLFWLIGGSSAFAQAQEYPTKPIRIIVPLSAGAGADIAARIIAQRMNEHWKQPVIVENRPGAGGQIGTAAVVKAEPDGHTLMVQSSSHAANSAIYKSLPYDPLTDLVDVAMIGKTPYVMVSAASGPYKTLKSLIDAAKAKPGELAFASAGMGTSTHLASEYLLGLAGVRMIHLPFKGSPEALQDVLGGRAAFYMAPVNVAVNLVKEGKLNALGVSTKSRAEVLPEVPTIAGQGLPDYEVTLWFGMWAPAATSTEIVKKLNEAVNAIVFEPPVREQFTKLGLQPAPMKLEEFRSFVRSDIEMYRRVVRAANIQLQ